MATSEIELPFVSKLVDSLKNKNGLLKVLIGPRQVGKTTSILRILRSHFAGKHHYVSADQVLNGTPDWIHENWHRARTEKKLLVIDEIQKCENWSETLKGLWDEAKRDSDIPDCILLGSSSLAIQKGLSESLTGRFQLFEAYHWNHSETHRYCQMSFEDFLHYGGYPGSYQFLSQGDPREWSQYVATSIVNTVIEKDILFFNRVKSPSLFKQAFEILISYPAQEISYTKLLGQLQDKGNTDLIRYYLSLFEGAFLIKGLEKFSLKAHLQKSSSPKIIPMAPCFFQLRLLDRYEPEERGRAFEALVGAQLLRTGAEVTYWRERNAEVDFVLRYGRRVVAIEVKSGRSKSKSGLLEFTRRFAGAKAVMITAENYAQFERDPLEFCLGG